MVLMVVAAILVSGGDDADAIRIPETLADQKPVRAGPVVPGFPIDYLGVVWETSGSDDPRAAGHVEPHGALRFLRNGAWGPWIPLVPDGADAPGQWGSSLVAGGDAEGYQVRGLPAGVVAPRAVAINTTDGRKVTVGRRSGVSALSNCVSRAEWGADESLRYVDYWPETFEPVQAMTVHHTVTANDDPDPAATVRAIYRYHAVDRLWGDIAYQFLIDEAGRIYEGRWSGTESAPCNADDEGGEVGDGSDFGHNSDGLLVTGGHSAYYNQGNLGVALLGDFTNVEPKPAARSALEVALAEFATRHGLDPLAMVSYYNAEWDTSAFIETIAAHRDWPSPAGDTACPGDTFYPLLPGVRANTADLMGMQVPSMSVQTVEYATSRRNRDLSISIGVDPAVAGAVVSATVTGPDGLDTTVPTDPTGTAVILIRNHEPGCYVTEVTRIDAAGLLWDGETPDNAWGCDPLPTTTTSTTTTSSTTTTTSTTIPQGDVSIDGIAPTTLASGSTAFDATITGSGFAAGLSVTFSGGVGPPPTAVISAVSADGAAITLDIVTTDGGPKKTRYWDVTVTNPDGASATLPAGLTITT